MTEQVESCHFNNASEVVRDALRRQQEQLMKREALRKCISAGVASVKAGKFSRASADEVIEKARARKTAR